MRLRKVREFSTNWESSELKPRPGFCGSTFFPCLRLCSRILFFNPEGFFPTCMIVLRFLHPRGMLSLEKPAHGSHTCCLLQECLLKSFQSETYTLISETNSMKSECTGLIVKDLNARPIKMVLLSQGLSLISLWVLGNSSVSQFLLGTRENKVSCPSSQMDVISK